MINVYCIFFNLKVKYKEVVVISVYVWFRVCYKLYRFNNYKLYYFLSIGGIFNEVVVCVSFMWLK